MALGYEGMRTLPVIGFFFGCLLAASCGHPSGGYSLDDTNYFAERPRVVGSANQYRLCWRYGTMGFFFQPSSHLVNGKLAFSLHGTASSGALAGHYGEIPIAGQDAVDALRNSGAVWLEPDGREVKLVIQPVGNCEKPNNLLQATRETRAPEQ
jgi:hypothetical protein